MNAITISLSTSIPANESKRPRPADPTEIRHDDMQMPTDTNSSDSATHTQPRSRKRPRLINLPMSKLDRGAPPTQRPRMPDALMPYTGDYRCVSWNAQALFATDIGKQHAKQSYAWGLLEQNDFLGVLETHGVKGKTIAGRLPPNCRPFWAHGTNQQAGVGLLVQESFLANFNPVDERSWQILVPGRVGRLRLAGDRGGLDLYVVYMPSGSEARRNRIQIMKTIASHVAPREKVVSLLFGDFHFVEFSKDRWNKEQGCWSGSHDAQDAEGFDLTLRRPHHFHEVHQPTLTCDMAQARSRIDRIYSNHFSADQLDRMYTCATQPWTALSAHRALTFGRAAPTRSSTDKKALPAGPIRHPDWARRVALEYHERLAQDCHAENAARRLVVLKTLDPPGYSSYASGGPCCRSNRDRRPTRLDDAFY